MKPMKYFPLVVFVCTLGAGLTLILAGHTGIGSTVLMATITQFIAPPHEPFLTSDD